MSLNNRTVAASPLTTTQHRTSSQDERRTMLAKPNSAGVGPVKISRASILREELSALARADGGLLLDLDCRRGHFIVKSQRKHVLLGFLPTASRWAHAQATEADHRQTARRSYRDALEDPRRLDLKRRSEFFDASNAQEDQRLRELAARTVAELLGERREDTLRHVREAFSQPKPIPAIVAWIATRTPEVEAPEFRQYVASALLSDPSTREARDAGRHGHS
jgi:hypothetical protein